MAVVTPPGPLLTAHLFTALDDHLIDLLRSLTPGDWERQTIAPRWTIKDVAAHLLDTQLRRLSFGRDGYVLSPPSPIASALAISSPSSIGSTPKGWRSIAASARPC